jgi:hypothetical protein
MAIPRGAHVMGPQRAAPGSAQRGVAAGRSAIARRGTGARQYNKPPNRTRGAGWAGRVGADPAAAAQRAPSSGGRGRGSTSRTRARCSRWAVTLTLEDQNRARGLAGIYGSPFGQRVYCAASNGTGCAPLPSGRAQQAEIPRQKKAQPEEAALKVPPKEEVLEECASARWAATHLHCSKKPNSVQALSAAMRHIVDF